MLIPIFINLDTAKLITRDERLNVFKQNKPH